MMTRSAAALATGIALAGVAIVRVASVGAWATVESQALPYTVRGARVHEISIRTAGILTVDSVTIRPETFGSVLGATADRQVGRTNRATFRVLVDDRPVDHTFIVDLRATGRRDPIRSERVNIASRRELNAE